jgi:hypothetical protein
MSLNQNQFALSPIVGMLDGRLNANTIPAQIDYSQSGNLSPGQAVKVVNSSGGVLKVIACAANSDEVIGFINYDIKSQSFAPGQAVEISQEGNIMYLQATGAIGRGVQVTLDISAVGGVGALVASSGKKLVGYAMDKASASGDLIRVRLKCPSFVVA